MCTWGLLSLIVSSNSSLTGGSVVIMSTRCNESRVSIHALLVGVSACF